MSRFGVQVFKGFIGNVLTAVIGFLGSILFARVLGPGGYGAFYTISAVVNLADNPVQGFGIAGKKRLSESDTDAAEIVGAALLVGLASILLLSPFVLLFGIPFIDVQREREYFVLLLSGLVFFKLLQPLVAGSGKFGIPTVLDSGRSFFTITLQVVLVYIGWDVGGMVAGLAVGSLLMVPISYRVLGIRPAWPSRDVLRNLWEYARWSMPKAAVGAAISRMDILILSTILTTGAAGQYRAAMNILVPATFVSGVIGSGVFVDTSETISRNEDPRERIELGVGFASILAIPILFGAIAMPVDIVTTIYGTQYQEAGTVLVILAAYKLLETQTDQLFGAISGLDRPDIRFYISLGVLVMNVGLGVPLAYRMGLMGVVIATLLTAVAQWIAALYLSQRLIDFSTVPKPILEQLTAGIVMFLIVFPAHRVYGVGWWGDLFGLIALGAAVYGLVLFTISPILRAALRSFINDIS